MIDKVNLQNYYNNYQAGSVKKVGSDDQIFSLEGKGPGVIYEPSGKTENTERQEKPQAPKEEPKESVTLELSGENQKTVEEPVEGSVRKGIQEFFEKIVTLIKSTFESIWNGTEESKEPLEDASNTESASPDNVVKDILKSRDMNKLEQYLTADGTRQPAKNTDLLTYYDRKGKIVSVDPSDKRKILQGDYNDLKL